MTHELETIIDKLRHAAIHVKELKAEHTNDPAKAESVEDVELALEWAIKKLQRLGDGQID